MVSLRLSFGLAGLVISLSEEDVGPAPRSRCSIHLAWKRLPLPTSPNLILPVHRDPPGPVSPWSLTENQTYAFLISVFYKHLGFLFLTFAHMLLIVFHCFLGVKLIILTWLQVPRRLYLLLLFKFSRRENFEQNGRKETNAYLALPCAKYLGQLLIAHFNLFLHDITSFGTELKWDLEF